MARAKNLFEWWGRTYWRNAVEESLLSAESRSDVQRKIADYYEALAVQRKGSTLSEKELAQVIDVVIAIEHADVTGDGSKVIDIIRPLTPKDDLGAFGDPRALENIRAAAENVEIAPPAANEILQSWAKHPNSRTVLPHQTSVAETKLMDADAAFLRKREEGKSLRVARYEAAAEAGVDLTAYRLHRAGKRGSTRRTAERRSKT